VAEAQAGLRLAEWKNIPRVHFIIILLWTASVTNNLSDEVDILGRMGLSSNERGDPIVKILTIKKF
jgi:hypothetical protein